MSDCCASGSCEVCRHPSGYSRERREQIRRDYEDYIPPWTRERNREDGVPA
jgi:hypothetical protein